MEKCLIKVTARPNDLASVEAVLKEMLRHDDATVKIIGSTARASFDVGSDADHDDIDIDVRVALHTAGIRGVDIEVCDPKNAGPIDRVRRDIETACMAVDSRDMVGAGFMPAY